MGGHHSGLWSGRLFRKRHHFLAAHFHFYSSSNPLHLHVAVFIDGATDGVKRKNDFEFMTGCEWCFHVAASYHLWLRGYGPMYAANVEGTRNVIEAAVRAGCSRIVYTRTVGCGGVVPGQRLCECGMRIARRSEPWI